MIITLIGYRATGKTTVSQLLAQRLAEKDPAWRAVDVDREVEQFTGRTIVEIFQQEGEEGFRDKEQWLTASLCRDDKTVIATGGGVVIRPENRDTLKRRTTVVWLQAEPETIFKRMFGDETTATSRPSLTEDDPLTEIKKILEKRTPWYEEIANITVMTESLTPEQVTDKILTELTVE